MNDFPLHTQATAPEASRPILAQVEKAYGFLPNLIAVLAESPALAKAYTTLAGIFDETSLTATERQTVLLTASRENGCEYCMAAHSTIAGMSGVPVDVTAALRDGTPIADSKLEALRVFTRNVVQKRGWLDAGDLDALVAAGYGRATAFEVILGVGLKTLSNYTNHIAETPLDDAFAPQEWKKAS